MTSIMGAFNTALSSLQVQQSQAALISDNIANASTPGYVQRGLPVAENVDAGTGASNGVMAGAIQRLGSATLEATANQAASVQAYSQTMMDGLTAYMQTVGQPADSTSLPSTMSALQQALTTLSASPADVAAQQTAVNTAQAVVTSLHGLNTAVLTGREQADTGVANSVAAVNSTLAQIATNQAALHGAAARGDSTASFEDTQSTLIASLSQYLPVQVTPSGPNSIAIFTTGGTTLFDGTAHTLSVTPMSQVTVDGQTLPAATSGSIAASLTLRDTTLPGFQTQLDQIAGNLIATFQAADPTVTTVATPTTLPTGIFTDAGNTVTYTPPSNSQSSLSLSQSVTGLAGRIALNASVDPTLTSSAAFHMAAGANASAQTLTADNTTVLAFLNGMQATATYTATGMSGSFNLADATSQTAGLQQSTLSQWTSLNTSRTTQATAAQTNLSNQTGVNVDEQLQRLLVVQRTYSASAEVVQAVMKMLDQINTLASATVA